jgi:hypothetical protein
VRELVPAAWTARSLLAPYYVGGMGELTVLVVWLVGLFVVYWVIRAAVKGGILDADLARARAAARQQVKPLSSHDD